MLLPTNISMASEYGCFSFRTRFNHEDCLVCSFVDFLIVMLIGAISLLQTLATKKLEYFCFTTMSHWLCVKWEIKLD